MENIGARLMMRTGAEMGIRRRSGFECQSPKSMFEVDWVECVLLMLGIGRQLCAFLQAETVGLPPYFQDNENIKAAEE